MSAETVILVHGIWMNGLDMGLLHKRLAQGGFEVRRFSYHSVRSTPVENALALQSFSETINNPVIHYVCHSLGGLVVRHLFHNYPQRAPGRVVTLGTPHNASSAVRLMARFAPARFLFGRSIVQGLLGNVPPWSVPQEIGVIAGTMRFGLGLLVSGIPEPNDGTVAVSETMLAGMTDHIIVPTTHTGMLFSRTVAEQTIHFLKNGYFRK
jgi:pimeloyl-ACP methyl ester carboxylesterase